MKFTKYFEMMRHCPDRAIIEEAWIQRVIDHPIKEVVQKDGRIRRWAKVSEGETSASFFSQTARQFTTPS